MSQEVVHQDFLGEDIQAGDYVITCLTSSHGELLWAVVDGLTPKMVRIKLQSGKTHLRYARDVVVISPEQVEALKIKIMGKEIMS